MAKEPFPSDLQDKFMLRLPSGLRDRIKVSAEQNNRSMNSEIVALLEKTYPAPRMISAIEARFVEELLRDLEGNIGAAQAEKLRSNLQAALDAFNDQQSVEANTKPTPDSE